MMRATCLVVLVLSACGGSLPETRYYDLAPGRTRMPARSDAILTIDSFDTDPGYDDDRMVYRTTPVRMDYYHYHRWSAAPGVLVANQLERVLERSGRFRQVLRSGTPSVGVRLRGRVVAIEEVDVSKRRWLGRIALELYLEDVASGEVLWSRQFDETEPLRVQSPEGLARALSTATRRIALRMAPEIATIAREREALGRATAEASRRGTK